MEQSYQMGSTYVEASLLNWSKKWKEQVFNFLFHPEVPYDNNVSEQAIRNVKVKQKVSVSFRSERGAEIFAILRSIVDTIIKKGGNPFESIRFTMNVAACKNKFMARQKYIYLDLYFARDKMCQPNLVGPEHSAFLLSMTVLYN
ncbi:MAG: transposase [Mariniphaga sp.]|nr:transposase [Mariniphaga sp.]